MSTNGNVIVMMIGYKSDDESGSDRIGSDHHNQHQHHHKQTIDNLSVLQLALRKQRLTCLYLDPDLLLLKDMSQSKRWQDGRARSRSPIIVAKCNIRLVHDWFRLVIILDIDDFLLIDHAMMNGKTMGRAHSP